MHDAFSRDIREGQRVAFSLKGEPGLIHGKVAGGTPVEILAVASHQGRVRQFKLRAQDVVIKNRGKPFPTNGLGWEE